MPARISITTSQGNTNTNRRLSSPLVSPLPSSSSAGPQLHITRDRNARRHSRHTSWSTGHDLASASAVTGDSADSAASSSQQRRRRESNLSLASVSERGGGQHNNNDDEHDGYDLYNNNNSSSHDNNNNEHDYNDKMALRNTSMDWKGYHARSRSQSQAAATAMQNQVQPDPSASASSSPLHPAAPSSSFPPSSSTSVPPGPPPVSSTSRPGPVTWMSLPRKKQLCILGLCRVFDFLQIASLQAYMFYQLKSFDEDLSDSDVSTQAGILQGAFTAAQFATAIPWGRVADAEWGGRKFVLLVGLLGTALSCLGVAFSKSFAQAVFWRSFGGAINGTVGIIRTAIAENVKEKKYHSRAFLILPIGFNIASLFGPGWFCLYLFLCCVSLRCVMLLILGLLVVMGGMLADPVKSYPTLFGPNSSFGGQNGVQWLMDYPYALPMFANTVFLTGCAIFVATSFEEVRSILNQEGIVADQDMSIDTGCLQRKARLGNLRYANSFSRAQGCRSIFLPLVLENSLPRSR